MTTIPERIREEGRSVYEDISDRLDACGCDACTRSAADIIAQALLAAEKRGREEEREDAARKAIVRLAELQASYSDAMQVAAAIRSTN